MRILFVQKRLLIPADTGGKIRTLNVLRHLARWHDVHYLCNILEEEEPYRQAMEELGITLDAIPWRETSRRSPKFAWELLCNLFSKYPYNVNKDFDPRLRQRAIELTETSEFDLVICDFVQMARNVLDLKTPKVLFQHNVEAEIFERHAVRDKGWLRRKYMGLQAAKMRRFEGEAGAQFDAVVAVSERDRSEYQRRYGWEHSTAIDTAVDTEFFAPQPIEDASATKIVFVGSMDWLPNIDGADYFVEQIFPLIREQAPHAEFRIVGRNPTPGIQRLGEQEGIVVTGSVDDVRPELANAAVVVVPLRIGGGTRLKIYEAMAMQKAVVSTTLGAEGLAVTHDEDILLADDPQAFAGAVLRVLDDRETRRGLERQALGLAERFSSERVARQFEAICFEATGR